MDTQSFLRLKATAKKPSFANPEIMQVCKLHLFEARRRTLLEMPEGLRYADEGEVFAPGQTRCMAARSGGRCRSAMASNSVLSPFCHYHLCRGGRHRSTLYPILTDYELGQDHMKNQRQAAQLQDQAQDIQTLFQQVGFHIPQLDADIRELNLVHDQGEEAVDHWVDLHERRAREHRLDAEHRAREHDLGWAGTDAIIFQRRLLSGVRRVRARLEGMEQDIHNAAHYMRQARETF